MRPLTVCLSELTNIHRTQQVLFVFLEPRWIEVLENMVNYQYYKGVAALYFSVQSDV